MSNTSRGQVFRARARVRSLGDAQELFLAVVALLVGLIYVLGPERWQTSGSFAAFATFPGELDGFGWLNIVLFVALVKGRFYASQRPLRWAHSGGAGIYFLYGFLLSLSIYPLNTAQSGAAWLFAFGMAFMHYRSAMEVNGKVVYLREVAR